MTAAGWTVSDDVVWAGEDTVRIYQLTTGQFQSLNGTGSSIWCLMAGGKETEQIAQELTNQLAGGDPAAYLEILSDVQGFLLSLARQNMVVANPGEKTDERRGRGNRTDEVVSRGAGAGRQ